MTSASSDPAALTLDHAIVHIYREAQLAQSCEEHENAAITLRLLGLLRDGWSGGPRIFDVACGYAVGLCHAKYLYRKAQRAEFTRLEYLRCIPDYDASTEKPMERDPTDGRRHFGNKFAWRGMGTDAIKEASAKLGINKATIYSRLSRGWTWEQASSETRISGRTPDGFRNGNGKLQRDIEAAKLANLSPIGDKPKNEGQARELVGLAPEQIKQIANSPTVNTNDPYTLELRLLRIEQLREAGRASWSASVRAKRKQRLAESLAENEGKKLLDNASDYLYGEAQGSGNAFARDGFTLGLRLLAAVRRGEPDPFLYASYAAFGSSFPKYIQRRSEREDFFHAEFRDVSSQRARASLPAKNALVAQGVPRVEPNPISAEDGRQPAIGQPLGDRQTDNRRKLAAIVAWPESTGLADLVSG